MARISKGKFRFLRDHFQSQKYFTITKKNIESMKIMLGDNIQVGEQYIMRTMPMTPELIAAMQSKPNPETVRRLAKNLPAKTKALLERKTRWAE